jgi:hypothetical protein
MDYLIKFSREELQLVINGLGELPAKISINLIQKIQQEVFNQEKNQPTQQPTQS